MRELTMFELDAVSGGDGAPSCPAGSTLTNTTYNRDGSVNTYTCTPDSEVQKSDVTMVGAVVAAVAAVVTAVVAIVVASP